MLTADEPNPKYLALWGTQIIAYIIFDNCTDVHRAPVHHRSLRIALVLEQPQCKFIEDAVRVNI